jgi:hypothetical protein
MLLIVFVCICVWEIHVAHLFSFLCHGLCVCVGGGRLMLLIFLVFCVMVFVCVCVWEVNVVHLFSFLCHGFLLCLSPFCVLRLAMHVSLYYLLSIAH